MSAMKARRTTGVLRRRRTRRRTQREDNGKSHGVDDFLGFEGLPLLDDCYDESMDRSDGMLR